MTLALFVLTVLAGARVTRFITDDVLFEPVRAAVERRFGEDGKLATLLGCAWCSGIYVFAGAFLLAWLARTGEPAEWDTLPAAAWFVYPAAALAASWLYAIVYSFADPAAR